MESHGVPATGCKRDNDRKKERERERERERDADEAKNKEVMRRPVAVGTRCV